MFLLLPPWVLLVVGFARCLGMVVRFFLVVGFFLLPPRVFSHLSQRHSHKPPHNHTPILPSLSAFLSFAFNPTFQIGHNLISWSTFSFPPWKLSQSATPLYLRGNAVVFRRKVQAFNFNLLRTTTAFPTKFGQALLDYRVEKRESVDDGFLESLVNVPNLISMGRLISGPVLDWMKLLLHSNHHPQFLTPLKFLLHFNHYPLLLTQLKLLLHPHQPLHLMTPMKQLLPFLMPMICYLK